jgi:hypothetical protein
MKANNNRMASRNAPKENDTENRRYLRWRVGAGQVSAANERRHYPARQRLEASS